MLIPFWSCHVDNASNCWQTCASGGLHQICLLLVLLITYTVFSFLVLYFGGSRPTKNK